MEAKDTVLTGEEMSQEIQRKAKKWGIVNPKFIEDIANITANKQAEATWPIAFKAGYKEGQVDSEIESQQAYEAGKDKGRREAMKEVVEWLQGYAIHGGNISLRNVLLDMEVHSPFYREAFLKERLENKGGIWKLKSGRTQQ